MAFTVPPRSTKPRETGLTSIIDFGPDSFGWSGPRAVRDLMDCAADYIDYAKIFALNALLLPEDTVREIVSIYRDAGVQPYAGGIYLEYALQENAVEEALDHLTRIGIATLELSENYVELSSDQRRAMFERLRKRGFEVIYEFGRKNPEVPLPLDELEELVEDTLARGIRHIIFEQSEFDALAAHDPNAVEEMKSRSWFGKLVIEADPYRFPKQHAELIRQFGPDVSLGNITTGQAYRLETLRRGIGRAVNYNIITARSL